MRAGRLVWTKRQTNAGEQVGLAVSPFTVETLLPSGLPLESTHSRVGVVLARGTREL
jgi:hypothetical protein